MAIIGDDEVKNKTISVRTRKGAQKNGIPLEEFIEAIGREINNRDTILGIVPVE
jgi:threonyl-tRNA synthetase